MGKVSPKKDNVVESHTMDRALENSASNSINCSIYINGLEQYYVWGSHEAPWSFLLNYNLQNRNKTKHMGSYSPLILSSRST